MKLFYKYDSRYTIEKNNEFKYDKTIVWSVDHSWNSVEWCLPGLYYLKKHYNVNLVFLASDPEIWQRAHEEENIYIYTILKNICDTIIINTIDPSSCNWLQRKIYRIRKSLLEEESLKYFFKDIKVDVLLERLNPRCVNEYFRVYHSDVIRIAYEHSCFQKTLLVPYNNKVLAEANYFFCSDKEVYDSVENDEKHRVIVTGAPQLDIWWRDLINGYYQIENKIDKKKKVILVLLPAMLDNERLYQDDERMLIKVLQEFYGNVNIVLKFHPREKMETKMKFVQNICAASGKGEIIITTLYTECISKFADCVIVVGETSAAAAAIINDVPVIEFHSNRYLPTFYFEQGIYGTLFKIKEVILAAEDDCELKDAINGVLYNNAWDKYHGKYKDYIYHDDCASKRFSNVIINIMR